MSTATKRVRIEVTANDIRLGLRNNCHECPIARAIRRRFRVCRDDVDVSEDYVATPRFGAKLPAVASLFVERFDNCGRVKPFSFMLKIES